MWTVTTKRLERMQDLAKDERQNGTIQVTFTVQPKMHRKEINTERNGNKKKRNV